jgi:signal transduction histidine kinase
VLGALFVGLVVAQLWHNEQLAIASAALMPSALLHVALTFPSPTTLVRLAPNGILVAFSISGALGLIGLRTGARSGEALEAVTSVLSLLAALAALGLIGRLVLIASQSLDRERRMQARIALAGGLASLAGFTAWRWAHMGGPALLVGGLALPLAIHIAASRKRLSPERAGLSEALGEEPLSLEQTARGIAHAMLKPITAVDQQLRLVLASVQDPTTRTGIQSASELMEQLQRLVRDLLDLARAPTFSQRRRISLARIVEQAVAAVRPRFIDAAIEIELAEGVVVGDEVSLRCMLVNLLENALTVAGASQPRSKIASSRPSLRPSHVAQGWV